MKLVQCDILVLMLYNTTNPDLERPELDTFSNLDLSWKMENSLQILPVAIRLHFEHKLLIACLHSIVNIQDVFLTPRARSLKSTTTLPTVGGPKTFW